MKLLSIICGVIIVLTFSSCSENKSGNMHSEQQINDELKKITTFLRDTSFALEMGQYMEATYYKSQGQIAPDFLPAGADSLVRSLKEEKIATNIAAFYALECGIGALMQQKGGTPVEWLHKIVDNKLDSSEVLVLNRFANATWKAGQPFRGLKRTAKDNFISPVFLSAEEVKKDFDQVTAAAVKLAKAMEPVKDSSKENQLQKISSLLKDKEFSMEMAQHMEAAYYESQQQTVPAFLKPGEDTVSIKKRVKEEKIATNIAGFYALECGLSYLATAQNKLPSAVLQSIVSDSISNNDKILFERFANATWKAGQPFRGLDRINRETFTSFDLLPPHEIEKDWVQIKGAAQKLQQSLK